MRWKATVDGEWIRCFAWIPIRIQGWVIWLEHYYYREWNHGRGGQEWSLSGPDSEGR